MTEPLKILYMLHDSRRSGVPAVASHFIRQAELHGIKPVVLFAYDGIYAEELRAAGVPVVTCGRRTALLWRIKRFLMNFYLLIHGRKFDVVHIHSTKLAWSVLVATMMGLKVVFHIHEIPDQICWLLRRAIGAADSVVFCSATCADHFSTVAAKRRQTIVNAIEANGQPPVIHAEGNKRIVMVGSINRGKGQDLLLKAFTKLQDRDAELYFYGTVGLSAHKYVRDLKLFAEKTGVADRVFFPGSTTNVYQVFSDAAIVVHTSLKESFGMVLVEAMSCGVPVIANDIKAMRDVVVDGSTGYLVASGDIGALVSRIDELLADPGLRNRLGSAGFKLVQECFLVEQRCQEYLQLYRELCAP